jgi:hypothetical protein
MRLFDSDATPPTRPAALPFLKPSGSLGSGASTAAGGWPSLLRGASEGKNECSASDPFGRALEPGRLQRAVADVARHSLIDEPHRQRLAELEHRGPALLALLAQAARQNRPQRRFVDSMLAQGLGLTLHP